MNAPLTVEPAEGATVRREYYASCDRCPLGWLGPVRSRERRAELDADEHNRGRHPDIHRPLRSVVPSRGDA